VCVGVWVCVWVWGGGEKEGKRGKGEVAIGEQKGVKVPRY